MKRDLVFEARYPDPPETVWRALTDPTSLAEWLMPNDFQPRVGHRFQFRVERARGWSGVVDCTVLVLEPPRKLSYSWRSGKLDTVVTWTLEPSGTGTRLTLAHTGFRGPRNVATSYLLGRGWRTHLLAGRLPALLARWRADGPPGGLIK
jgi:uncharacterized protein YndB with AHSA1/START domain